MAKISIKLKPFSVPNFVIIDNPPKPIDDGFTPLPSFPLSQIDADDLSKMCDDFRLSIFDKAGKADPKNKEAPDA